MERKGEVISSIGAEDGKGTETKPTVESLVHSIWRLRISDAEGRVRED